MKKLLASIIICELAGVIGSVFTAPSIPTWYAALNKPSFGPPNWLFGPVWITLYFMMGISLYLIWKRGLGDRQVKFAFWFFIVHLFFNTVWSIVFFGFQNIAGAFVIILMLLGMIVWSIKSFWSIDRRAASLLAPYLVWVSFATVLNYSLMVLNAS